MTVGKHMIGKPVTVTPQDSLATAQAQMQAGGFRQLPVVTDGKLVGIVTDRDVRRYVRKMRITEVKTAMTKDPETVTPVTTIEEAAQLLLEHKIGGLPVLEADSLVGIITTTDILRAFLDVMGKVRERSGLQP
ncbi:MAG: CBS domain-containing protein [Deltaproteobacteria bacterium]|nr:CBS domain-containing protein [Deltaproteobacteria bacterium]MCZ6625352.1 CBS domain-containing protein [Deltaproteobacteria bacterium]